MACHLRHRLRRILRTSLLVALALSVPLQAALGMMVELHESTAHADPTELLLGHLSPDPEESNAGSHQNWNGTLHLLLHHVHCCGHSFGVVAADFTAPPLNTVSVQLPPLDSPAIAKSRLTNPFRPPIQI